MSRPVKLTPQEVKEDLEERAEFVRISELAENWGVSTPTIRKMLKALRQDGEPIFHNSNGIALVGKEDLVDNMELMEVVRKNFKWMYGIFAQIAYHATACKPLLPTMRRELEKSLTREEARMLLQGGVAATALGAQVLAYLDIED